MKFTPDDIELIEAYNNVEVLPTLTDVSEELGIPLKTIKNRITKLRKIAAVTDGATQVISRAAIKYDTPVSEDASRFMEDWDEEKCIAELRRVVNLDLDKVVSRNYFRVHSVISESTWNRYFGTFEEFKRQAGITLSRQQHGLERQIAKHASVDHYRGLNRERLDYGHKYEQAKNRNRYKTIMVASDMHDIECDALWLRVFLDTAKRVQPDLICLNGDIFDLAEFGKYGVDPREWDAVGRIRFVHDNILGPLRKACPNSQIDFIEGNHEARLLKQLTDASPGLRAVLADLHGWSIGKILGLDEFEINYIAKQDLAAWTVRDQRKELANNYKVYWDTFLAHHFPQARNMGMPGVNGHHHKHVVWSQFNVQHGTYEWHQLGSGHRPSASYCEGEKWGMGFAIVNLDVQSRTCNFDYVPVTDMAVSGGKWYHRKPSES